MSTRLLTLRRPLPAFSLRLTPFTTTCCATTLLCAGPLLLHHNAMLRRPMLMDSFSTTSPIGSSSRNTSPSISTRQSSVLGDGRWVRQVSGGSILGVVGGVLVSAFSKPLALLIGLLTFGVYALESRGIHIVPYKKIQGYVKDVNVQSTLQKNVAFKMAFGATFALAAFAQF